MGYPWLSWQNLIWAMPLKGLNTGRIMDLIQSKYHFLSRRPALCRTLVAFSLVLASSGAATAQEATYVDFSDPNVIIDLSVIDGGGYQDTSGATATAPGGSSGLKLLMPGSQTPVSMLHVPTVSGKPLSLPKKQRIVQTARKTPDPVIKEAPAPAPVVKQAPKPVEAATTPKKLEAPEKPATPAVVAATAPRVESAPKAPPPVPVVKPTPKVAETEAPKAPPVAKTQNAAAPQQAALPPAAETIAPGQALRIPFAADKTKLPEAAKAELIALAEKMKGQKEMRLQLMAYAGGPSLSSSLARRMSLSRALSIRSFLIESGVRSTRIDVRALGNKTKEEPINRVDLNVTER